MNKHLRIISILLLLSLASANHPFEGKSCKKDSECLADGWETCQTGVCKHKDLWPMKGLEFWGMIATFFMLWIANMGGIGGGGTLVPICILFFNMSHANAIPISNFSIFLSSAQRYLLNSTKPHPLRNGRGILVDYNLAIIMLPGIISGVSVGGIINALLPKIIVQVSYIILLGYVGFSLIRKLLDLREKETKALKEAE